MSLSAGDRIYTKGTYDSGVVIDYMGDFDFPKVRVLMDGQTEPVVYYEDSLLTTPEPRDLETVLVIAENSESSDAILLAAEVRRLRKIEDALKDSVERKRTLAASEWQRADDLSREGRNTASIYTLNDAVALRDGADELERILEGKNNA